jgi:cell division septal protein FtsQ
LIGGHRPRANVRRVAPAEKRAVSAEGRASLRRALRLGIPLLVVAPVVVGLGFVASRATAWLDRDPRFRIGTVEIDGNDRIPDAEILDRSGLRPGDGIFDADIERARERLLGDERVREAAIEKELPATIRITVRERVPVAVLADGRGGLFLVGDDGTVFHRVSVGEAPDLPVLTGFDLARRADDPVGLQAELESAAALVRLVEESGLPGNKTVAEVHRAVDGGLDLVTSDGLPVHLGTGPYRDKLRRLGRLVGLLAGRNLEVEEVHLAGGRRPERITVRVRQ